MSPTTQGPALAELREAYDSGELVIFAGPGVSTAAGLPSHKQLVERLADLARARGADPVALLENIQRDLAKSSIALLGEMRIGKTSLMHQLEHRLGGRCLRVSLQRYAFNLQTLPQALAQAIAPGVQLQGEPYELLDRAVTWRLGELARTWGSGDELGENSSGSDLLRTFQTVRLWPLSREEPVGLVRTPLGEEYTVTDEAIERVFSLSGGRPHIAQMLCRQVLGHAQSPEAANRGRRHRPCLRGAGVR